jgi:hypothetical protein
MSKAARNNPPKVVAKKPMDKGDWEELITRLMACDDLGMESEANY